MHLSLDNISCERGDSGNIVTKGMAVGQEQGTITEYAEGEIHPKFI